MPNRVYESVRRCLYQAGLDRENFGTPAWNPLGKLVPESAKVFVLCNFVYHWRTGERQEDFWAKCTHGSVLRAIIDYILVAVGEKGQITFGNAPLQSANWEAVLRDTEAEKVLQFYRKRGLPVQAQDLRERIVERDMAGRIVHLRENRATRAARVDLGKESLLEEIADAGGTLFRVGEYDARKTESYHGRERHVYEVHRQILESDLIFSVPKLKTHQKVGMTGGIKGCVGAVTNKECLAHHRFGPPSKGGDEYPEDQFGLLELISKFHDLVWSTASRSLAGNALRIIDRNIRRIQRRLGKHIAGGWWGNDTAWRMALDIARIVSHVDSHGRLHDKFLRPHYVLVDGIVGGEGNGPLAPKARSCGYLLLSNNVPCGDYAAALSMGFDPMRIQLIRNAFLLKRYDLSGGEPKDIRVFLNGAEIPLESLADRIPFRFRPPPGWEDHL
jgi:hypothetical protein